MKARVRELTPRAPGGVSVVAVDGEEALARVARLVPQPARLVPGRLVLTELRADGELLDEALVLVRGASSCELHLHGSPPVCARVRAALGGDDPATSSTSLEEEAWSRLADAPSEPCARMLLDQAEGALRRELLGLVEMDERDLADALGRLCARGRIAAYLERPPRVVIAGPSNAGKSTLFNRLLGEERALIDAAGGTTRDALHGRARLGEWVCELVDTAGERALPGEPSDAVEGAGQRFGRELRSAADWVVWLDPDPRAPRPPAPPDVPLTHFVSRADELPVEERAGLVHALSTKADCAGACARVATGLLEALGLTPEPWRAREGVPFTSRHRERLASAVRELEGGRAERARERIEALLAPWSAEPGGI